jgi:hypothetical protein
MNRELEMTIFVLKNAGGGGDMQQCPHSLPVSMHQEYRISVARNRTVIGEETGRYKVGHHISAFLGMRTLTSVFISH